MNSPGGKQISAWFDGACEPRNPGGHASWGIVVEINGEVTVERSDYVGFGPSMSNNVAEYCGCIAALEEVAKLEGRALLLGDSQFVVYQMSGRWKARGGLYLPYFERAQKLLQSIGKNRVEFRWVPRLQNERADQLSKAALHEKGVVFVEHQSRNHNFQNGTDSPGWQQLKLQTGESTPLDVDGSNKEVWDDI